jgi:hypothetical protein
MIDDYTPGIDDQFDDGWTEDDDRCEECSRCNCDCYGDPHDDEDDCEQCALYGPMQCTVHGAAEIECARQYHEHFATIDALESILSMPDAWHGSEWSRLRESASVVLAQMKRSNW